MYKFYNPSNPRALKLLNRYVNDTHFAQTKAKFDAFYMSKFLFHCLLRSFLKRNVRNKFESLQQIPHGHYILSWEFRWPGQYVNIGHGPTSW